MNQTRVSSATAIVPQVCLCLVSGIGRIRIADLTQSPAPSRRKGSQAPRYDDKIAFHCIYNNFDYETLLYFNCLHHSPFPYWLFVHSISQHHSILAEDTTSACALWPTQLLILPLGTTTHWESQKQLTHDCDNLLLA